MQTECPLETACVCVCVCACACACACACVCRPHSLSITSSRTFPNEVPIDTLYKLKPQFLCMRLGQTHVSDPQTRVRVTAGQNRAARVHLHGSVRIPVSHLRPRAQYKHLDIQTLWGQNDSKPEHRHAE